MAQVILNTVITVIVTATITALFTYSRTLASASKSLKDGVLSLLRLMIIQSHDKYVEQEYCPLNEKEVIEKAYSAYHNLGGNGAITIYYNQIMALPTERKDESK